MCMDTCAQRGAVLAWHTSHGGSGCFFGPMSPCSARARGAARAPGKAAVWRKGAQRVTRTMLGSKASTGRGGAGVLGAGTGGGAGRCRLTGPIFATRSCSSRSSSRFSPSLSMLLRHAYCQQRSHRAHATSHARAQPAESCAGGPERVEVVSPNHALREERRRESGAPRRAGGRGQARRGSAKPQHAGGARTRAEFAGQGAPRAYEYTHATLRARAYARQERPRQGRHHLHVCVCKLKSARTKSSCSRPMVVPSAFSFFQSATPPRGGPALVARQRRYVHRPAHVLCSSESGAGDGGAGVHHRTGWAQHLAKMAISGAALGPLLDGYHSAFGVLVSASASAKEPARPLLR